jgi:transposase
MNKSIDGLAAIACVEMAQDPCQSTLFVFVNRSRDKIKMLLWETNGFWIFYKRLESQRFIWPDWFDQDALSLTSERLDQLLQGFNLNGFRPHKLLKKSYKI